MRFTVPLLCALAAPFCQAAQMPLPELKTTYLECERAARAGALETAAVMNCSTVYEELKQRAFGGDAEALFAWVRDQLPLPTPAARSSERAFRSRSSTSATW